MSMAVITPLKGYKRHVSMPQAATEFSATNDKQALPPNYRLIFKKEMGQEGYLNEASPKAPYPFPVFTLAAVVPMY